MKRHYTTCFDSNYLAKGIAMIQSLIRHSPDSAFIHVLAMDEQSHAELCRIFGYRNLDIYHMAAFEAATGVGELRKTRTHQEYCWTVGSVFTYWIADWDEIDVTYLDADVFFFSDPEVVFAEIGDKSIGITPHRFAKKDEARLIGNGRFAVQWVTFKGEVGRACLSKWAGQVREWCYYRHEDGKFGDQKYLDTWPTDYPGEVCEIANPGVGLAPWNVANYYVESANGSVIVADRDVWTPLVLYHFHEYIHGQRLTNWPISDKVKDIIYAPYIKAIEEAHALIEGVKV